MKVLVDEQGYITSYALEGNLENGIELPFPEDLYHFEEHYPAYRVRDGAITFNKNQDITLRAQAAIDEYRARRESECFSVINRGGLWYENLTDLQKSELRIWYRQWLDGTPTQSVPEKPTWLK